MARNSERLKSTKKGSLRLPEILVNNVYFCRKERAALQLSKMIVAAHGISDGNQYDQLYGRRAVLKRVMRCN